MAIFSDQDLQGFSDLAEELAMRDTCQIQRRTQTSDGQGGSSSSGWSTVASVPCLVVDMRLPVEQTIASQLFDRVGKKVILPRNTDVRQSDQLVVAGETYRVVGLLDPTTYEVVRRVLVTPEVL